MYKFNPLTGNFDLVGKSSNDVDGGSPSSVYLSSQSIDGGGV